MKKRKSFVLQIASFTLLGALVTLAVTFNIYFVIYNGEWVTEKKFEEIMEEKNASEVRVKQLEANLEKEKLMNEELEASLKEYKQTNEELENKPEVEYSSISLVLNGKDTKYVDNIVNVNNETFYSIGFLQWLVDNQAVSSSSNKLFLGDVQSEENMPISLYALKPFTSGNEEKVTNIKDTYGISYEEAIHFTRTHSKGYSNRGGIECEYHLDKQYSKFTFDVIYIDQYQNGTPIQFIVNGDNSVLKVIELDRKTEKQSIEVAVSGINFLQLVTESELSGGTLAITHAYLYK